jgi:hypothetical protein
VFFILHFGCRDITMEVDLRLEQDIQKGQLEDAKIQEIKE